MKYLILAVVFATGCLASHLAGVTTAAPPPQQQPLSPVPANPNIDFNGYLKIAREAALHREMRRLSEDDFIKMSKEKGTIVLDARSKEKYEIQHVEGDIKLSFADIE